MAWFTKKAGPIDASAMLGARDQEQVEGERGRANLSGRPRSTPGAKPFLMVVGATVVVIGIAVTAQALSKKEELTNQASSQRAGRNLKPDFRPADVAASTPPEVVPALEMDDEPPVNVELAAIAAGPIPPHGQVPAIEPDAGGGSAAYASHQAPPPSPAELLKARRLSDGFGDGPRASGTRPAAAMEGAEDAGGGALQAALQPMRLKAQAAGKLANRDYLLTQGAMLDCVLETKIVSSVPGMTSCHLTRDVYSTNGRVVVLDRGSRVVGFYQGGIRRGQSRLFIQWSRVETPKGVVINLASPGTGPLGEAGVGGHIDTHFGERFGGAMLLSVIDDLGDYFASRRGGNQSVQFGNTGNAAEDMARTTLENSVNIPPTLYKNQGERVAIFVARDLDFRGVYDLARR